MFYHKTLTSHTPDPCPACAAGIPKKSYRMHTIPIEERFANMQKGVVSEMGHHVEEWTHSGSSAAGRCIHCKAHVNLIASALVDALPQTTPVTNNAVVNMDMIRVSYDDPAEPDAMCIFMANTKRFHYDILTTSNGIKAPRKQFLCPKTQAIL